MYRGGGGPQAAPWSHAPNSKSLEPPASLLHTQR